MRYVLPVALAALLCAPAGAVATHTGEGVYPLGGTTNAAQPALADTVMKDDLVPFVLHFTKFSKSNGQIAAHGTIQVRVVRTKDGTLSFYWKINNAADSKVALSDFLVSYVPDRAYDANWRIDGLGTAAPDSLQVVKYPDGQFQHRFHFTKQPIGPGQSSRFFFLKTAATKTAKATLAPLGKDNMTSTTAVAGVTPAF